MSRQNQPVRSRARTAPSVARVLLRLPGALHQRLKVLAAQRGTSINQLCVTMLSAGASAAAPSAITAICERAEAVTGPELAGVVAVGSVVRGEAGPSSDLDVLIVVDRTLPLTRALYAAWDERPLSCDGRLVDAHFVHRPSAVESAGAVWWEAAVDGIVWYDRDGAVQALLRTIRLAMAEGRLVRRRAHGQPYWTAVA